MDVPPFGELENGWASAHSNMPCFGVLLRGEWPHTIRLGGPDDLAKLDHVPLPPRLAGWVRAALTNGVISYFEVLHDDGDTIIDIGTHDADNPVAQLMDAVRSMAEAAGVPTAELTADSGDESCGPVTALAWSQLVST